MKLLSAWFSLLISRPQAALALFLSGYGVGYLLWMGNYGGFARFAGQNQMEPGHRVTLFGFGALVGGALLLAGLVLSGRGRFAGGHGLLRLAKLLAPGMVFPLIPPLLNPGPARETPLEFLIVMVLFGLGLERTLRWTLEGVGWDNLVAFRQTWAERLPRVARWVPVLLLLTAFGGAAAFLAHHSVAMHQRLQTAGFDLGIFDNLMWNLLRGEWFKATPETGLQGNHFMVHANFIAYLFAPFYALSQRAETLLVLQAVMVAAGALPLFFLARRLLGSSALALFPALGYLLFPPALGPVFYDFHFLTLAPFFVFLVALAAENPDRRWFFPALLLGLAVREDLAPGLAVLCLFLSLRHPSRKEFLVSAAICAGYFGVVKFWLMPVLGGSGNRETFAWLYAGLAPSGRETGFSHVLLTMVTNPLFLLKTLLKPVKIQYVLCLAGPWLFLPFRHWRTAVLFIVPSLLTLFATDYDPVVTISFQYTAHWTSALFLGGVYLAASWKEIPYRRPHIPAALLASFLTIAVFSLQFGPFIPNGNFRGGFQTIAWTTTPEQHERRIDLATLLVLIPPKASVAATEYLVPQVSARKNCFTLRHRHEWADLLLIDVNEGRSPETVRVIQRVLWSGRYGLRASSGIFQLWERDLAGDRNTEGLVRLGMTASPPWTVVRADRLATPLPTGSPWDHPQAIQLLDAGLRVEFPLRQFGRQLAIGADNNDGYTVRFRREGRQIGMAYLPPRPHVEWGLAEGRLELPFTVSELGVDEVELIPAVGDPLCSVSHLYFL